MSQTNEQPKEREITFEPTRVGIGEVVPEIEVAKRLAYQLQLPYSTYGSRLLKVYKQVIEEALLHGEGLNIGPVIIKLKEYDDRYIPEGRRGGGMLRARMYRYILSPTKSGNKALTELTAMNFSTKPPEDDYGTV